MADPYREAPTTSIWCTRCKGKGEIQDWNGFDGMDWETCPDCKGVRVLCSVEQLMTELVVEGKRREQAEALLRAILQADQRGQGTPFAEAMKAAAKFLGFDPRKVGG